MTRRDRLDQSMRGGGERGWYGCGRRTKKAIAWLGMGLLACVAGTGFLVDRPSGSAQATLDETKELDGRLTAAVVVTDELESDRWGRFSFEGFGARPLRLIPIALRSEISLLREHRDRLRDWRRFDPEGNPFPDLPVTDEAPPRMDSGHPDPDRLLPSSRPVTENVP